MLLSFTEPRLTLNVVDDVRQLFDFPFMVNAFRAGTIVAITAALIGWFMVLRKQTFAGHTLALIGFPGGAGAVFIGVSAQLGFFAFCIAGALLIALLPNATGARFDDESAVIAMVQVAALAAGFLFVSLHGGNLNGINSLLFGGILGITEADVVRVFVAGVIVIAVGTAIARPLLFTSIDPAIAAARGVPVRLLSIAFTLLLGLAAASAAQITGALLVFTLLVIPAASAQALTSRPLVGLALAVALALGITWIGLGVAYYSPYPIGFWTTTIAFAVFLGAQLTGRRWSLT